MQGFFARCQSRRANQKSKSRQGDYIKEPESSAVKGAAVVDGAIAPLTARTAAADNSAAGSHPHGCDPLISLIIYLFLQKQCGPDNIYVYDVAPLAGARIGPENRITGKK